MHVVTYRTNWDHIVAMWLVSVEDTQQIAWAQAVCDGVEAIHRFPLTQACIFYTGWVIHREIQGLNTSRGSQLCWEGRNAVMRRFSACITPGTALQMLNKDKSKRLDCNESWDCRLCGWTKVQALLEVLFNNSWLCMIGCRHQPFSITLQRHLFASHRETTGATFLHCGYLL